MIGTIFLIAQNFLPINGKQNTCLWLLTVILIVIMEKGSAIMLLGPEKIQNHSNKLEYPKNIYLYKIDNKKKLEVTGFWEYWYQQTKYNIAEQFHHNQLKINQNSK
ncbi:MAG: hypothetical protein PUB18_04205 [bacterium]|nr:hypothetical protein [bacterium]